MFAEAREVRMGNHMLRYHMLKSEEVKPTLIVKKTLFLLPQDDEEETVFKCVLEHVCIRFQHPVDDKHIPTKTLNYLCLEFNLNTHTHAHTNCVA